MYNESLLMYIYAETQIHPGSGTSINSLIDLPIQRERHTEFPIIQGSSLKGVLRSCASRINISDVDNIFGNSNGVGGASFTDAKILGFPIRSLKGVFGWITCPLIISRYIKDLQLIGDTSLNNIEIPDFNENEALISENSNLIIQHNGKSFIYLEEIELECKKSNVINNISEKISENLGFNDFFKEKFKKDLVIIDDTLFRDFVALTTEVIARIKIGKNGITEDGSLRYEEFIPTDTLLYSLILFPGYSENKNIISEIKKLDNKFIQIGGDETVGKGFVKIKLKSGR
ncbi:MAG: type III-B CRISPR module RAMP protein Cmr4 [Promethearchaeota archaeon]